ncbi:MAG: hypothetical protein Q9223_005881, partial [Gallowayella weberi]
MSPRGGGGGSGAHSISSSSGMRGGSNSGSSSKGGSSSTSGSKDSSPCNPSGTKGGTSSTGVGGSNSKGGKSPKMPTSGHGSHGSHFNSATETYTSAAIPSKRNPFSFLSRRSDTKPLGQTINETGEKSAAYRQGFLSGLNGAGYLEGMDAANKIHKHDIPNICQTPYKPYADINPVCSHNISNWSAVGIIFGSLIIVFGPVICLCVFLARKKQKSSKKARKSTRIAGERSADEVDAMDLDFMDLSRTEIVKAKALAAKLGWEHNTSGKQLAS